MRDPKFYAGQIAFVKTRDYDNPIARVRIISTVGDPDLIKLNSQVFYFVDNSLKAKPKTIEFYNEEDIFETYDEVAENVTYEFLGRLKLTAFTYCQS